MKRNHVVLLTGLCIVLLAIIVGLVTSRHSGSSVQSGVQSQSPVIVDTHGMVLYSDPSLGFTFWYPGDWDLATTSSHDTKQFPGAVLLKTIRLGPQGGVVAYVVSSAHSTITDEPDGHAAPINQTKYFYDDAAAAWMVAYPEGSPDGSPPSTTTADVTHVTPSGLILLKSGRRFDTSIIPLSLTTFLVVSDGGGADADPLSQTVALVGKPIASSSLSAILADEARAYASR